MGNLLSGQQQNMQPSQGGQQGGGASSLLTALPGILSSFKGVNAKNQSNISGQQQNVANAMYNPSNPLYQQLYGQERQNIQQTGAQQIAQAGNQNRLLSSMGRTPLFSQQRNGEEAFRQSVMNQQGADVAAQNATRGILSNSMSGLNTAMVGANERSSALYGPSRIAQGANNQTPIGFSSIGQFLNGSGGNNNGSPFNTPQTQGGSNAASQMQMQQFMQALRGGGGY